MDCISGCGGACDKATDSAIAECVVGRAA